MPKLRNHIPIIKKVLAARWQILHELGVTPPKRLRQMSLTVFHETVLMPMLESRLGSPLQLDHDPALGLRHKVFDADNVFVKYIPDEHDHRYMRYRREDIHLQKTTGRRPGAERTVTSKGSDIWLMKKFRRLEGPPKRKQRIPSRPFPKGRKFR